MISHPSQALGGFRRFAVRTVALWLVVAIVAAGQVMHAPMSGHGSGQAMAAATAALMVSTDPATTDTGISTASLPVDTCGVPRCWACVAFLAAPFADSPRLASRPAPPVVLDGPVPAPERLYRPPIHSILS